MPATRTRRPRLPELRRVRRRSYTEWKTLRRWGALPAEEEIPVGHLLRAAREEAGLSQSALGARLGISQQAVSRAEQPDSNPTVDLLRRWAAACDRRAILRFEPR